MLSDDDLIYIKFNIFEEQIRKTEHLVKHVPISIEAKTILYLT